MKKASAGCDVPRFYCGCAERAVMPLARGTGPDGQVHVECSVQQAGAGDARQLTTDM
jgi:hypothetical protein